MGSTRVNEPAAGVDLYDDRISSKRIFGYREIEFGAWTDIDYKGVATPGTAEVVLTNTPCRGLYVLAHPLNIGKIAVGPNSSVCAVDTLAAFRGFAVYPGAALPLPVNNTNLVYADNLAADLWAIVYFTHTDS